MFLRHSLLLAVAALAGCGSEGHFASLATLEGSAIIAGQDSSGIPIHLFSAAYEALGMTTTDADGRYRFESVPRRKLLIVCDAPWTMEASFTGTGLVGAEIDLQRGDRAPHFALTPAGKLTATLASADITRVLLDGTEPPLMGGGPRSLTITTTPGPHVLTVSSADLPDAVVPVVVEYQREVNLGDLIAWAPRATLTGKLVITGAVGPLPPIPVSYEGPSTGTTLADATGQFVIPHLIPGEYLVTPNPPSVVRFNTHGVICCKATLTVGQTTVMPDFTFQGLGTVSGRITVGGGPVGTEDIGVGMSFYATSTYFTTVAPDGTYSFIWWAGPMDMTVFRNHIATATKIPTNVPYLGMATAPDTDIPP
jgi:hypothetical protein